jgi:hypothetical protein
MRIPSGENTAPDSERDVDADPARDLVGGEDRARVPQRVRLCRA